MEDLFTIQAEPRRVIETFHSLDDPNPLLRDARRAQMRAGAWSAVKNAVTEYGGGINMGRLLRVHEDSILERTGLPRGEVCVYMTDLGIPILTTEQGRLTVKRIVPEYSSFLTYLKTADSDLSLKDRWNDKKTPKLGRLFPSDASHRIAGHSVLRGGGDRYIRGDSVASETKVDPFNLTLAINYGPNAAEATSMHTTSKRVVSQKDVDRIEFSLEGTIPLYKLVNFVPELFVYQVGNPNCPTKRIEFEFKDGELRSAEIMLRGEHGQATVKHHVDRTPTNRSIGPSGVVPEPFYRDVDVASVTQTSCRTSKCQRNATPVIRNITLCITKVPSPVATLE